MSYGRIIRERFSSRQATGNDQEIKIVLSENSLSERSSGGDQAPTGRSGEFNATSATILTPREQVATREVGTSPVGATKADVHFIPALVRVS